MYVPEPFAETDTGTLHDFIEANSFGVLTSHVGGELFASHLPFLLERERPCLVGHLARANPQWSELEGQSALVVFSGPHAYVSPSWYEAENVVPTWNFAAVHAYGVCRLLHDEAELHELLLRMVDTYERSMPKPWTLEAGPFFEKMARQVVGFRIEITRLEGKWKLNQNHAPERREKVAAALAQSADQDAREIAQWMRTPRGA